MRSLRTRNYEREKCETNSMAQTTPPCRFASTRRSRMGSLVVDAAGAVHPDRARRHSGDFGVLSSPSKGLGVYFENLLDPDTRHAVFLTLTVAPCAVVLNLVFGVAAAWAIARFRFRGRTLLITLIDIPFSISPVVAGLMFVLLFGVGRLLWAVVAHAWDSNSVRRAGPDFGDRRSSRCRSLLAN